MRVSMSLIDTILDMAIDIEFNDYDVSDGKINFYLNNTTTLDDLANYIRHKIGYAPLDCCEECSPWSNAVEGWYNWYIIVGKLDVSNPAKSEIELGFSVNSSSVGDESKWYDVDLDGDDREKLYYILFNQCEEELNKNFVEILAEVWR